MPACERGHILFNVNLFSIYKTMHQMYTNSNRIFITKNYHALWHKKSIQPRKRFAEESTRVRKWSKPM